MAYIKFQLKDGTIVYLESAESPRGASGLIPPNKPGEHPADQSALPFEDAVTSVRKMAASLVEDLRDGFTLPPDEVQVNFGLKASAEVGGLVVARGGMESNYNVMLRWRKASDDGEEAKEAAAVPEAEPAKKGSARAEK